MSNKVNSEGCHMYNLCCFLRTHEKVKHNKPAFHSLKINHCFELHKIQYTSLYHCTILEAKDWKLLGGWALYQTFTNGICCSDTRVILMKPKRMSSWLVLLKLFRIYFLSQRCLFVCISILPQRAFYWIWLSAQRQKLPGLRYP